MRDQIKELVKQLEEGTIDKGQFEARIKDLIDEESDTEHRIPAEALESQELRTAAKRARRL
jgi:hypothetical protein